MFKEFSDHCLCLVLSEDGTATVCVNEPAYCCYQVIAGLGAATKDLFSHKSVLQLTPHAFIKKILLYLSSSGF